MRGANPGKAEDRGDDLCGAVEPLRVAVYYTEPRATLGGGSTLRLEVMRALCHIAPETRHAFIWFGPEEAAPRTLTAFTPDAEYISVRRSLRQRVAWRARHTATILARRARYSLVGRPVTRRDWIAEHLARNGIDLVLYLSPRFNVTLELPFFTVVWDLEHRRQPFFPEVSTRGQWDRRELHYATVLRRAATVITGTHVGREEIERFYHVPTERIRVIPLPTPAFALAPPEPAIDPVLRKYGLSAPYLFYPAQFWPHKNHVGLLAALRLLKLKRGLALPVVFAGSNLGGERHVRDVTRRLGLEEQVRFLGFVPRHDLVQLYRGARALAFVTHFGPDNLPPLEAFALGCPVVASRVPGAEEQLGDAALLVDPASPSAIADGIERVHRDEELRRTLIERGTKRAHAWTPRDYALKLVESVDAFSRFRILWP